MTRLIYHITTHTAWAAALEQGRYTAASLDSEGFIHCSTKAQLLGTANAIFRGQTGLALLVIDEGQLASAVVYEDCYDTGDQFPHLYAPLPLTAVRAVLDFPCRADGTFVLPPDI